VRVTDPSPGDQPRMRAEPARNDARDTAGEADDGLGEVLSRTFERLGKIGQRLLSMNLHLLPFRNGR
jgi:hypothetical protein